MATMLLAATPALAEDRGSGDDNGSADAQESIHANAGLHLGPIVSALAHQFVAVNKDNDNEQGDNENDQDSETGEEHEHQASTTLQALVNGTAAFGTVSSVSGTSFTLNPMITFGATTSGSATVQTSPSTQFRGGATSTGSLSTGSNVIVVGTTSTSTPGTIAATIVILLQNVANFLHELFSH